MRQFLTLVTVLCLAFTVSPILAGPVADSLAFQGRLTDASDVPVPDGLRDLIISIWTDSLAGTMVHSEMVVITTSKGLYSTCIGCGSSSFPSLFTGQTLFLQTQLSGQAAMSPRTRLRAVPSSMSSSSVNGSATHGSAVAYAILNARQAANFDPYSSMSLDLDSDGDGNNEFIITDSATPSAAMRVMSHDSDDDGLSDGDISMMLTPTTSSVAIKSKGLCCPNRARVMSQVDDTGSLHFLEADLDNDGLMERTVSSTCDATSARLAIKTKGTSAQRLSAGGDCDDTDSEIFADCDDDNDGVAESRVSASSSLEGAAFSMHSVNDGMPNRISMNVTVPKQTQRCVISQGSDSNLDGIDETSMTSAVERKSGSIIYLDREGNEVLRSMVGVDSTRGIITTDHDSDGDGVPESEGYLKTFPLSSSVAIKTKGTGADANRVVSTTTPDSVVHELLYDDDQVGSELTVLYRAKQGKTGSAKRCAAVTPTDTSSSDEFQTPDSLNEVVSITGGGGAGGTYLYGAKQGKTGKAKRCETFDASARSLTTEQQTPDSTVDESSFYSSGSLRLSYKAKAGSTGATKRCAFTGPSSSSDIDEDCDDLHSSMSISHSSGGNDHSSDVSCDASRSSMQFSSSNLIGTGTALTLQTDVGGIVNPIEHSSGAHLTAGGVWTNASDENLKENFQSVDGAELLEKIEQLQISEWNYKNESDETKHIGPTAQDFQKIFGVGSDGKSISTIDPSGIALAAIKELKKENTELKKQIAELATLKAEVEQLKKLLVEKK